MKVVKDVGGIVTDITILPGNNYGLMTLDSVNSSEALFNAAFAQRESIKTDEGFCLFEVKEGPCAGRMIVFFYT